MTQNREMIEAGFKSKVLKQDMPYEKFLKIGPEYITDTELLAIIIRTGVTGESPLEISQNVLKMVGNSLLGLHHATIKDLMSIKGIGEVKAVKIKCVMELSTRLAKASASKKFKVDQPKTVADYYMERLRHEDTERILLVMLDSKNGIIDDFMISKGTVNASLLSPREIFIEALRYGAVYIMLLHNHPSGDPTPSKQDCSITKRISEVASLIGIPLIDHIIIGDRSYISFKEANLL